MLLCTHLIVHSLPGSLRVVSTSDWSQPLLLCSYLVRQSSLSSVNNTHRVCVCFQPDAGKIQKGEGEKERNCSFQRKYLSISKTEKAQRRRVTTIFTSICTFSPKGKCFYADWVNLRWGLYYLATGAQLNCGHSNRRLWKTRSSWPNFIYIWCIMKEVLSRMRAGSGQSWAALSSTDLDQVNFLCQLKHEKAGRIWSTAARGGENLKHNRQSQAQKRGFY